MAVECMPTVHTNVRCVYRLDTPLNSLACSVVRQCSGLGESVICADGMPVIQYASLILCGRLGMYEVASASMAVGEMYVGSRMAWEGAM